MRGACGLGDSAVSVAVRPGRLIAAACGIEILGMGAFATFPALLGTFRTEWALSNTAAGWIAGVYFVGYVAAVAVLTALTDRVDARRIYLVSMALAALGAAAGSYSCDRPPPEAAGAVPSGSNWVGWGRRSRTPTYRSRICCPTIRRVPSKGDVQSSMTSRRDRTAKRTDARSPTGPRLSQTGER